ncbi:MAG: hypothetical protein ACI3XC_04095 [Phascolarctobacterium sp.]
MLELAHKLADSDRKFFGGWVLAGVEAHIHGAATKLENRMLLEKERKCIIQVRGTVLTDSEEQLVKELRVFLVLPKNKLGSKSAQAEAPVGKLLVEHVFTVQEVREYVAYTGDKNIIHQGEHPIVPGLCMAAWLQQSLELKELDWRISFLAPVYTGDALKVYATEQELTAYVGSIKVFLIKL